MRIGFEDYAEWLIKKAGLLDNNFVKLGHVLMKKKFYYLLANDINRYIDGLDVRNEYVDTTNNNLALTSPCTCLEMIYALAKRISNILYDPDNPMDNTQECVFCMLQNLGLLIFDDENFENYGGEERIFTILDRFLSRSYDFYGNGGLFPNINTEKDQRNVEIWYQMEEYIGKNYM